MSQGNDKSGNFVLHAMRNNRAMLINHVKQRAMEQAYPVNLTTLDRAEYDLDKCFKEDGELLEHMKVHGYRQYH